MFLSGGVESFKVFPQSFDCCLHCHNTMSPLRPLTNFKYIYIFSKSVLVFGFMLLMVDHIIGVAIVGGCDQPITCTSLSKSTSTTPSVGTLSVCTSRLVGVEVCNVLVIATFLEAPKKKRKLECDIQWVFKDNWATKFPWAKPMVDLDGKVQQVHCKICLVVEGKEKLLNPILDGL